LPDLDALSAVALGPPQTSARRRVDPPHVATAARSDEHFAEAPARSAVSVADGAQVVRVPKAQLLAQWFADGGATLGKTLTMLQQPKMALAAVVAIGLQLAAVLAMLTGTSKNDGGPDAGQTAPPVVEMPFAAHAGPNDPIQTPLTVFGGAKPSVPPQTLPGLDPAELPAWPGDGAAPQLVGPTTAPTAQANTGAKLAAPPAVQVPTLAPPTMNLPGMNSPAITSPAITPPVIGTPTLPQLSGPKVAPAVRTDDTAAVRPKARLQGTIKKISTTGTTP
jgi:hypothetical protein